MSAPDTTQAFGDRIWEFIANTWSWVIGLNNFWSVFFATIAGAVTAFELERRRRRRERVGRECGKANGLIATLDGMRYVLDKLNAAIPQLKEGQPTPESREPIAGIPASLPSIDFRDLDFLLETNNPSDPCAQAYARIALVQAKFDAVLSKMLERNDLARRYQDTRGASVLGRGEEFLPKLAQTSQLREGLNFYAHELVANFPDAISLIEQVVAELRRALAVRYPGRQFLNPYPESSTLPHP